MKTCLVVFVALLLTGCPPVNRKTTAEDDNVKKISGFRSSGNTEPFVHTIEIDEHEFHVFQGRSLDGIYALHSPSCKGCKE